MRLLSAYDWPRSCGATLGNEAFGVLPPKVARQDRQVDVPEVDHHQRVERVAEGRIDVEAEQAARSA